MESLANRACGKSGFAFAFFGFLNTLAARAMSDYENFKPWFEFLQVQN